jgi:hypothetical protein
MKLPKSLTTVTPVTKIIALILFISLPFTGFLFGIAFERIRSYPNRIAESSNFMSEIATETTLPKVLPYNVDDENNFVIELLDIPEESTRLIYWTDQQDICSARISEATRFISVPLEEINEYVFVELVGFDEFSRVFAVSPNSSPQCDPLTD